MVQDSYERARTLLQSGNAGEAARILESKVREDPGSPVGAYLLGIAYFRMQQFSPAEACFRRAISLDSRNHLSHYYLGLVLERQKRQDDAAVEYRLALAVKPGFKEAQKKLGVAGTTAVATRAPDPAPEADSTLAKQIERGGADELSGPNRAVAGNLLLEKHRRLKSFSFLFIVMWALIFMAAVATPVTPAIAIAFALPLLIFLWLLLSSTVTKYWIHERRIDFLSGILFKKRMSVWLFQIEDTWLTRSPFNLVTNDATVHIRATGLKSQSREPGHFQIAGLGNSRQMRMFWEELRDAALVERRAMKSVWV